MTIFNNIGSLHPPMSAFDLSYEKKFTADMGQLIPVLADEMVPGDFFQIGNQAIIRFQPMVAPILHEINMFYHVFFVPYRLLWDEWEDFITGGITGDLTPTPPTWDPTLNTEGSLWDYLGFPTGIDPGAGARPLTFPRDAYNLIFNEYYRDETLQTEVALDQESVLNRNWEKDYFTSSLPFQQRGTAPALPVSGSAVWDNSTIINTADGSYTGLLAASVTAGQNAIGINGVNAAANALNALNDNVVALTTFDISDLRLAFQIQKWMERNARAGARYTEFLTSHFGVSPKDERLQRPEYIGGSKVPIIISEVLQTSSTDVTSPQGNLAGHGITVSNSYCGSYKAKEFGVIIGIMSVMPKPSYQQGINRQWLRRTKFDFYFPEFANLSEQAVERGEICALDADPAHNQEIFAYQGRYDEMRIKHNLVAGQLRSTYDYWHLGRIFNPATPPELNESFIQCIPRKDIFAVPSEPGMIVSFGNILKAFRPLPVSAEPGLIDHN